MGPRRPFAFIGGDACPSPTANFENLTSPICGAIGEIASFAQDYGGGITVTVY
jgi:hypothetical protein